MSDLMNLKNLVCKHEKLVPEFDKVAAEFLPSKEIRLRWPRANNQCPDCNERVIVYASSSHFYRGYW